jgi:hypothetical protein
MRGQAWETLFLGGVDKFHSATAGGKNRQFEEAR